MGPIIGIERNIVDDVLDVNIKMELWETEL